MELPLENIERDVLVRTKEVGKFGIKPEERSVEKRIKYSIINIDKPKGPTSHQVSAFVQKILGITKSGHSGTLDPGVTGCLPIALDKATRIVQTLLPAGKEYVALMHLHDELSERKIRQTFKKMTGKIMQLPPIKSAIKRQLRPRTIYYIEILEIKGQDVLFRIGCEAGTYIRKYIHDFGQKAGTGAHMQQLRRTKVGNFNESTLVSLQDLADALHYYKEGKNAKLKNMLQPIEYAVRHMHKVWVSDSAVSSLISGSDLNIPGIVNLTDKIEPDQKIALLTLKGELIALGIAKLTSKKMLENEKGLAVNVNKVFYQE